MQVLSWMTSSNFHSIKIFIHLKSVSFCSSNHPHRKSSYVQFFWDSRIECLQICLVNSGMCLSFNKSAKSDLQFRLFWPQAQESIYGEKFQSILHNSKIPNIPIFPSKLLKSCGISNQVNAPLIKEVCYAWFIFFE